MSLHVFTLRNQVYPVCFPVVKVSEYEYLSLSVWLALPLLFHLVCSFTVLKKKNETAYVASLEDYMIPGQSGRLCPSLFYQNMYCLKILIVYQYLVECHRFHHQYGCSTSCHVYPLSLFLSPEGLCHLPCLPSFSYLLHVLQGNLPAIQFLFFHFSLYYTNDARRDLT